MGEKFALSSKAIWGAIMMIVNVLAQMFGWEWWQDLATHIGVAFEHAWNFVTAMLLVWGRWTAKDKLTIVPKALKDALNK